MNAVAPAEGSGLRPGAASDVLKFVGADCDLIVPVALGEPPTLLDTLEAHADQLDRVRIHRMDPFVSRSYINGDFGDHLRHYDYFLGPGSRQAYWDGRCELVPNHFSEMPLLLRMLNPSLILAAAAGPGKHGYFSLGTNADYVSAFIGQVPFFLEVMDAQPYTYGQNQIHISQTAGWIRTDAQLPAGKPRRAPRPQDEAIAGHIAEMIPNGACLQVGVGSIPDALLRALGDHKDLGIHTECFSDGLMELANKGVATGTAKQQHRNKHVTTFCVGSPDLMRWLDHNPAVEMMPVEWTNDPRVVAKEPNFMSINATTEVDLMGQAASETIAGRYWSSSGGQADFAHGAMYSPGGKAFLVLHSATSEGHSKIRTTLTPGSVVTTLKNATDHVVTEYGVARLRGASLDERARRLIAIAHPDHRDELTFNARKAGLLH
ncbi:acetyl-CoA hydrolase/transferase C-terminal domain-containing protein [Microtetraspora sp. NBRC 16547]|uniref:acetyl-CoA hydrolase/transferase family protein n=1 Tax=Microtetraspora sp. NBRC 16547 TaxID=3030993 RepID=UPI0024A09962|nr:acetyl-CoA hydrolase/transferase C-terminal domain-containing protein [Microtetraspora sp. NBRC 16547]GLW98859.1 4-hydroxybutyrate CoA-transferase [Microtetraspora sp. NBRC 16547]